MANWCENYVEIKGPKKILDNIETIVDEKNNDKEREHGLLNYLRPIPKEEKENWYKWSVDNWGTKWDVKEFYSIKRNSDKSLLKNNHSLFKKVLRKGTEFVRDLVTPDDQVKIQTPRLPDTPMPNVQTTTLPGANTNLTRTQQALLSPEEQIIASRRT